jgi:hypothetical protein
MAGIFANVDSDITKLRSLKAEIENVKKALKSINVKVDIDIAKGLEARLKSLSEQYDALVTKVSEAEGKIMISTKRINDAAEKIIKVQEQMSKSTGISPVNNDTTNTTANMDTASVQMQVKAYDDLANEINSIIGTREQNIKRMLEEQNAIRLINAEIKQLTKYQSDNQTLSNNQQKRLEQLNNSLLTHKAALAEVRQTLSNNAKLDNAAATSMDALSQSLGRMRTTYRQLTEEERNSPFGRELLASINQADAKIKALDATIGNHQRNVGNYASGWNGLNMSIQQIGRELPSLAVSWNTFFLAISNNLPILADEIKRAKEQYNALKNSGEKAVPVWKQVVSSIFSWQSALTVGITLLTLYGGRVVDWISGLLGADSAQKRLNESVKEFNSIISKEEANARVLFDAIKKTNEGTRGRADAIKKINDSYGKYLPYLLSEKSSLLEIEQAYKNVNKALMENAALKAQKNAIDKVVEESLKVQSDSLSEIQKGAGNKNSKAITDIVLGWTEDFRKAGQTWQQAFNAIAENIQKRFGKMPNGFYGALEDYIKSVYESNREISKIQEKYNPFFNERESNKAVIKNKEYWEAQRKVAEENLAKISSSQKKLMDAGNFKGIDAAVVKSYKDNIKKLREAENELKIYDEKKDNRNINALTSQQDKILGIESKYALERRRQAEDLEYQIAQARISAMNDGYQKVKAQRDLDNKKEIQDLQRQKEDAIRVEIEAQKKVFDEQEKLKAKQNKKYKIKTFDASTVDTSNISSAFDSIIGYVSNRQKDDLIREQESAWNEYLIKFGNYQQKRQAIIEKYNNAIETAATAGNAAALEGEKKQYLEQLDEQYGKTTRAMADLFEDASTKSVSAIQDIIDKYETLIKYMSGTDKDISITDLKGIGFTDKDIEKIERGEISIKDVTDAIRGLKDELKGKSPWKAFVSDLEKGIEAIKKGGNDSKKVGQGITDIGNAVTSFAPALGEFGSNIANIFGADDSTITGITDALGGLGTTAVGVGQIMSGDIVGGAMSAVSGISSVVSAFEGLFGADYSGYEKMKAQYENLISIWDELITKKMGYIDIDYGTEAIKAAEEAEQLVNINISRQRQLIKRLASSGASIGSHSLGYRINERLSKEDYQRISGLVGEKITAEYQLWDLSSEQIEKILSDEKLVSVLDTVNKDFVTYLQNIVDYGEQLTEIAQKEKEAITGIGFDEFKNGYANLLSDLDSTNEDFADNFEQYLQKAIFQSLLANKYKEQIQRLYDSWAEYGKDGLTSDEAQALRNMQQNLTNSLLAERDKLMQDFGWQSDSVREASQKGIATASQDSVDENNGRLAVMQGHTYSINENVSRMATGIDGLLNYSVANLSATTDIDKTAKAIESQSKDILNHLANIDNYTSNLVEIREYMYAMKSGIDTLNTKGITLKR